MDLLERYSMFSNARYITEGDLVKLYEPDYGIYDECNYQKLKKSLMIKEFRKINSSCIIFYGYDFYNDFSTKEHWVNHFQKLIDSTEFKLGDVVILDNKLFRYDAYFGGIEIGDTLIVLDYDQTNNRLRAAPFSVGCKWGTTVDIYSYNVKHWTYIDTAKCLFYLLLSSILSIVIIAFAHITAGLSLLIFPMFALFMNAINSKFKCLNIFHRFNKKLNWGVRKSKKFKFVDIKGVNNRF